MDQPKIVIIGHVCIDHNKSEHAEYTHWGSSVLYMATCFERLYQCTATIVTTYGPDLLPYLPDSIHLLPEAPDQDVTLIYENDSRTGKRIQHCRNVASATPPVLTPEAIAALRGAEIVVVATLLPNYDRTYLQEVLHYVSADALKILCPQGYFRHVDKDGLVSPQPFTDSNTIVPLFDLVIYSEEDSPDAFSLAATWKQTTPVIVTQSSQGATILDQNHETRVPTTPIPLDQIVDSVGCGDTFATAVTYQYHLTKDLKTAVQAAHKVASAKLLATPLTK